MEWFDELELNNKRNPDTEQVVADPPPGSGCFGHVLECGHSLVTCSGTLSTSKCEEVKFVKSMQIQHPLSAGAPEA